jgi:hypothetical protein
MRENMAQNGVISSELRRSSIVDQHIEVFCFGFQNIDEKLT